MDQFLSTVWGDLTGLWGEIRVLRGGKPQQYWLRDLNRLLPDKGTEVFFGVLPRREKGGGNAESCVDYTHVLWADFDAKQFDSKIGALVELNEVDIRPQIIVDSGHGFHAYWLLDRSYPFVQAHAVMKGIERRHRSDHCSDKARIMRLPGTLNGKDLNNLLPVRIVKFDELAPKYRLSDFYTYVMEEKPTRASASAVVDGWEPSKDDAPKWPEGTRNNALARIGGIMMARGLRDLDLLSALQHENAVRADPPLPDREVEALWNSLKRYQS